MDLKDHMHKVDRYYEYIHNSVDLEENFIT